MSNFKAFLIVLLMSFFVLSCEKTDENRNDNSFLHGIMVTNEGNFMDNNGSVSYIPLSEDTVYNNVFETVNGRPLGDVIMSFAAWKNKGFIVANNSGKVEVVDLKTFQSAGIIEVSYPRHIVISNDAKGYITYGSFPGKVKVFNPETMEAITDITVGNQPENMIIDGDKLLVANGQWGNDSTVSIIDRTTNEVMSTIFAGDGPVAFARDGSGSVWVLCQGKVVYSPDWSYIEYETNSKLVGLKPGTYEPVKSYVIGHTGDYFNPSSIASDPNGQFIYFVEKEGVFAFRISDSQIPATPLISGSYNTVNANPLNGRLYVSEIQGYTASGKLHIFTPSGETVSTFVVGIAPNGVNFY